ncbi:MAG: prepilin peptidase [bacterium]|nr:prepilin peptidase [bacterium]
MDPFWTMTCAILIPGVVWASWIDYSQRRVPNWLNAALIALGFVAQGYYHGAAGMWVGLGGLAVGFGVLIVPWIMHAMGAGDVKLMAAIGVWFGPWMTLVSFALGAMIGGVIAVIMILAGGKAKSAWANLGVIMIKCTSRETAFGEFGSAHSFGSSSSLLPYGIPLTIGSLIVLSGQVFAWWTL